MTIRVRVGPTGSRVVDACRPNCFLILEQSSWNFTGRFALTRRTIPPSWITIWSLRRKLGRRASVHGRYAAETRRWRPGGAVDRWSSIGKLILYRSHRFDNSQAVETPILTKFDDCPISMTEVRTISATSRLFLPKYTASRQWTHVQSITSLIFEQSSWNVTGRWSSIGKLILYRSHRFDNSQAAETPILTKFDDCPISMTEVRTISATSRLFLPKYTASKQWTHVQSITSLIFEQSNWNFTGRFALTRHTFWPRWTTIR